MNTTESLYHGWETYNQESETYNQESEIMKMTPNKHNIQFINVQSMSIVECTYVQSE